MGASSVPSRLRRKCVRGLAALALLAGCGGSDLGGLGGMEAEGQPDVGQMMDMLGDRSDMDIDDMSDLEEFGEALDELDIYGDGGRGDTDAPVTFTVDGVTYGGRDGNCQVDDEVVVANIESMSAVARVRWFNGEEAMPYVRRSGQVQVAVGGNDKPAPFNLYASSSYPGTTWTATVDGNTAEITARVVSDNFGFTTPDHVPDGEFRDVTIRVRCNERSFGMGSPGFDEEPVVDQYWNGPVRPTGEIAIAVDGATYSATYLDICTIHHRVEAHGLSEEAEIYIPDTTGDGLTLYPGDPRDNEFGNRAFYMSAEELEFVRDQNVATWSGTLTTEDGRQVEADVTIRCDGDEHFSRGTATISAGGETHEIDYPDICEISGSTIDFAGDTRENRFDVDQVVSVRVFEENGVGGHTIHWSDGYQNNRVLQEEVLQVSGNTATWSGTLHVDGEDLPGTIDIECRQ